MKVLVIDDEVNYLKRNPALNDNEIRAASDMITRRKIVNKRMVDNDPTDQNLEHNLNEIKEKKKETRIFSTFKNSDKYKDKVLHRLTETEEEINFNFNSFFPSKCQFSSSLHKKNIFQGGKCILEMKLLVTSVLIFVNIFFLSFFLVNRKFNKASLGDGKTFANDQKICKSNGMEWRRKIIEKNGGRTGVENCCYKWYFI